MQATTNRPRKIVIQSNTPTQNGLGESIDSWAQVAKAWTLKFEELGGKEAFMASQIDATGDIRLTIRYMASVPVTAQMRVVYGSRVFDINSVSDVGGQNQFLELVCKENA